MNKEILTQYIDACELLRDTQRELRQMKQRKRIIASDSVKGSMDEFPYTAKNFHIQGVTDEELRRARGLEAKEKRLAEQEQAAHELKLHVEEWMVQLPARMQRIIRYRCFDGLSCEQVAARMGRNASADSVRMELQRFMREN